MKSLLLLWKQVADECATWCCTSTRRDYETVTTRSNKEGESFLTITLPAFGKDFERSLDQGRVDRNLFTSFSRKGELPRFLGGFLDRIFDRETGRLLDDPDLDAIIAVRELTLMFGKMLSPCSDARTEQAMIRFIECDNDVGHIAALLTDTEMYQFQEMAMMLFQEMFTLIDRKVYEGNILPKHGPGATADRLIGNEKFRQRTWTRRLERFFPLGDYLFPSPSYWEQYDQVDIMEPGMEVPVKVTPVPKTAKTPRIIAIEPTCMQYVQQGLLEIFKEETRRLYVPESKPRRINLLRAFICSDQQEPNQVLAKEGSQFGNLATLDLSDASDSVSARLVFDGLLHRFPHLREAILACRSQRADVPGQGEIHLNKFASMGSALCFPIEAMVFLTLVFLGIQDELNRTLSRQDIKSFVGKVRVYGDDIIVPVEYVHSVIRRLDQYGFKVNRNKSFWTGKFRESCGKEYYDGTDVSIVRVRRHFPTSRTDAAEVNSMVVLRNQFYKAGFWKTASWLDSRISRIIKHYPVVSESSQALGRYSFLGYETQRICELLHRPLVKGYVVTARIPDNSIDDHGALLKYFLKRQAEPDDEKHLERSGRPRVVSIKPRWVTPY